MQRLLARGNRHNFPKIENGILLKVNPPLRTKEYQEELLRRLKERKIDFIETDHAPHSMEDKIQRYSSGIPGLHLWPEITGRLRCLDFSEQKIRDLTFNNAKRIFGIDVKQTENRGRIQHNEYATAVPFS